MHKKCIEMSTYKNDKNKHELISALPEANNNTKASDSHIHDTFIYSDSDEDFEIPQLKSKKSKVDSVACLQSIKLLMEDSLKSKNSATSSSLSDQSSIPDSTCLPETSAPITSLPVLFPLPINSSIPNVSRCLPIRPKSSIHSSSRSLPATPSKAVTRHSEILLLEQEIQKKVKHSSLIKNYKDTMKCKSQICLKNKSHSNVKFPLHYHCLGCKTRYNKEFSRIVHHMLSCPKVSKFQELEVNLTNVSLSTSLSESSLPESSLPVSTSLPKSSLSVSTSLPESSLPVSTSLSEISLPVSTSLPESSLSVSTSLPESSLPESNLPVSTSLPESSLSVSTSLPESSLPVSTSLSESSLPVSTSLPESSLPGSTSLPESSLLESSLLGSTSLPESSLPVSMSLPESSLPLDLDQPSLIACWDNKTSCAYRTSRKCIKHFHCKYSCHSHVSRARIEKHVLKCEARLTAHTAPDLQSSIHSSNNNSNSKVILQAELICPKTSTWAVRNSPQGPAAPVHVICCKKGWECSSTVCQDAYNFHAGSLQPSFVCEHVQACISKSCSMSSPNSADLFNSQISLSSFSDSDKEAISSFCSDARNLGTPVIKQFLPTLINNNGTSRNLYYSVFAGTGNVKYYSRLGRVIVTYDRRAKTHKCECSTPSCIHKKISVLISQSNPVLKDDRPEDSIDEIETNFANEMMDYILEHKRIPFDMSAYYETEPKTEFEPSETRCHKCDVDLIVSNVNCRGIVFDMFKKTSGVKIITKKCLSCSMEFRYSEHADGYFNYNNNSIFSSLFMELGLRSWQKNTSLTSFLDIVQIAAKFKYSIHLILNAIKAYLSLKEMNFEDNFSCVRCGNHPISLDYDVIRNVCFDLDPKEVKDHTYSSFSEFFRDCCKHDLCRAYLNPKSPHFNSNVQNFSVKLSQSLPPFICPRNLDSVGPYTRPLVVNDRPEEISLPLERIEQIAKAKNSYRELKKLCKDFKLDIRGGKKHMVAKLIDFEGNAEVYSVIRKKFTNLTGKSGGILRAICPHGITYALKFLVLPESVADYTHVLSGFKIQPNFNFSDIASLIAKHTNNHYPGFFRPYMGRIDDPADSLSDLYKDGSKKAMFNFNNFVTTQVDVSNLNHDTTHPISKMCSVLSLYDRFHEPNHHEFDTHLRSIDSTNLVGMLNTSVAEQQNHVLSLKKSYCNEMKSSQHIKLVTYISSCHNHHINKKWASLRKKKQSESNFVVDSLGFLTPDDVEKPFLSHSNLDSISTKSPFPNSLLQDPSGNCSALNSVAYSLAHSHAADPVYETAHCLTKELLSFAGCKSDYCQSTHFATKQLIDKKLLENNLNSDPCSILQSCFLPDLASAGVLYLSNDASSSNISMSLQECLNCNAVCDYIFIKRPSKVIQYFNGPKPHFDMKTNLDKVIRYKLVSFVSKTHHENVYSSSSCICDLFFTVCNLNTCKITEDAFLEMSRSAEYLIFKLDCPLSLSDPSLAKPTNLKRKVTISDDPFEFEPPLKSSKKVKVKVSSSQLAIPQSYQWLSFSDTGRLNLFSDHFKICHSHNLEYDD